MLALFCCLMFGIGVGIGAAKLFDKAAKDSLKNLGLSLLSFALMVFFGSQQNLVPFFFKKVPFENFYGWIIMGTFFVVFVVTIFVQTRKNNVLTRRY